MFKGIIASKIFFYIEIIIYDIVFSYTVIDHCKQSFHSILLYILQTVLVFIGYTYLWSFVFILLHYNITVIMYSTPNGEDRNHAFIILYYHRDGWNQWAVIQLELWDGKSFELFPPGHHRGVTISLGRETQKKNKTRFHAI